ncbi:unnamed protein product [Rotaria sp. Silwood2]|nr:unnamed protein product [Rotaria sp. Silwood2]CAF3120484.1 unnamed protein product [Rotaria sp. Silwood2]CAF4323494.1 unnamed protein product [Rotaria sp. Silwood2]CAF4390449.1 unnamed protein product [Rotaria sp. Silwood2]
MPKLMSDLRLLISHGPMSMSIFSVKYPEQTFSNLKNQTYKFLWFQVLNDTLNVLKRQRKSKHDMLHECYLYYANNEVEQKKIAKFTSTYTLESAINWYTRDAFVYRLINKAFRTKDIDTIFKFRFFYY